MKQQGRDLETLLGEPKKAIRSLAVALSLSYLVIQLNSYIDTFWTALLGDVPMSAVSLMSPIYWIITAAGIGIGVGAASSVSFRLGENNRGRADVLATHTIVLGLIASVFTSAVMFVLVNPIITLLNADGIRADSVAYVFPFILLSSALILNGIVAGLLRAEGAKRKSVIVLLISAGLNIVLDPILMFGLGMGVAGAGWATALGALISVLLGLYWYVSGQMEIEMHFKGFRAEKEAFAEILGVAGPRTAEALITGVTNVFQRIPIVAIGGTIAVMVYNVPFRYSSLIVVIAEALGAAMIPVCSAALGQRDVRKMKVGMVYSAKLSFLLTMVLSAAVFVFAEPLMGVFTTGESMATHKDEMVWVLRMFCIMTPFDGLRKLGSSMLQVLRKSRLSTAAMLGWGILKLGLYSVAAMYSFRALIVCCVTVYVFGGILMMGLAAYYGRKPVPVTEQATT